MRIGSLFSGAGGLDLAVQAVFGGEVVWHAEIDKAASKVLAYRFPGVLNLGDVSDINWDSVPPVEVLCGGFPCQDVSAAGKRAGIKDGTRSGLWAVFAEAIDWLHPKIVVIENVRGLLSALAHRNGDTDDGRSDLEPDEATLGNGSSRPLLRAAGAVLGDLADLGYDAQWATVAAADVGAPHRRERVFIVASLADAAEQFDQEGPRGDGRKSAVVGTRLGAGRGAGAGDSSSRVQQLGRSAGCEPHDASHPPRYGWDEGRPESAGIVGGFDAAVSGDEPGVALLPTPRSSDCFGAGQHGDGGMDLRTTVTLLPTPNAQDGNGGGRYSSKGHQSTLPGEARLLCTPSASDGAGGKTSRSGDRIDEAAAWGKYEPAIRRWEQVTGQSAPPPTEPNKNGNPRLSAAFSEWLMGWPAGWVTDPAIGISRNDQLRCVGNGVVSLQAVAALRYLLGVAVDTHTHTPGRADVTPLLPTPCARDYKDGEFPASHARNTPSLGAISAYFLEDE